MKRSNLKQAQTEQKENTTVEIKDNLKQFAEAKGSENKTVEVVADEIKPRNSTFDFSEADFKLMKLVMAAIEEEVGYKFASIGSFFTQLIEDYHRKKLDIRNFRGIRGAHVVPCTIYDDASDEQIAAWKAESKAQAIKVRFSLYMGVVTVRQIDAARGDFSVGATTRAMIVKAANERGIKHG